MKQYQTTESGSFVIDGMTIPAEAGNRHYRQMIEEVETGEAEIIPYVEPEPTQEQINAEHRAYLTLTDWYVTRKTETGEEIPNNVLKARQDARDGIIE